ncbi:unnamed protein product [Enterobius vermicularis]|uniref:Ovule protein n=1 Tax=Enterobius vermicularis TaxID=51028 RepID=A0A0N4V348_ENTVE|nr:unnamed protein product [Enterobius vermicularis]
MLYGSVGHILKASSTSIDSDHTHLCIYTKEAGNSSGFQKLEEKLLEDTLLHASLARKLLWMKWITAVEQVNCHYKIDFWLW